MQGERGLTEWQTVYIGGGTPSLLAPEEITTLCENINLAPGGEWTIEANPEDIRPQWLSACETGGVNRLSLGIQCLEDAVLERIGRRGSRKQSLEALRLIRDRWKGELSLDLISGLPGQDSSTLISDIETLDSFSPNHISLYALTLEEGTPLARWAHTPAMGIHIPDEDESADIWIAGRDALEQRGYEQYEVSNFARRGFESKHNLVYWRMGNWVGCGPGASGTVWEGDRSQRRTNPANLGAWLQDPLGVAEREELSREDTIRENILMGMRLREGLHRPFFTGRFGIDVVHLIPKTIEKWTHRGDLVVEPVRIFLTREGLLYLNSFLQDCLEEF
jgi:oxygen-independent coproporphyrinogen-3 oxidase